MLPSAAAIPPAFFGPDLAALLGAVAWLAILPAMVALGVLVLGILTEDRVLAALRRQSRPGPSPEHRRLPRPARTAA